MGLGIAVVSADASVSCDQRRGFWISRGEWEAAGVLPGYAAGGGGYRAGEPDGGGVWIWGEVSGEVSEGAVHHGLVVWAADRGAFGADGVQLYGGVGEFCCAQIAAWDRAEVSAESDGYGGGG